MNDQISASPDTPLRLAGEWDVYPARGIRKGTRHYLKQAIFFAYLNCGWLQLRDLVLSLLGGGAGLTACPDCNSGWPASACDSYSGGMNATWFRPVMTGTGAFIFRRKPWKSP